MEEETMTRKEHETAANDLLYRLAEHVEVPFALLTAGPTLTEWMAAYERPIARALQAHESGRRKFA